MMQNACEMLHCLSSGCWIVTRVRTHTREKILASVLLVDLLFAVRLDILVVVVVLTSSQTSLIRTRKIGLLAAICLCKDRFIIHLRHQPLLVHHLLAHPISLFITALRLHPVLPHHLCGNLRLKMN